MLRTLTAVLFVVLISGCASSRKSAIDSEPMQLGAGHKTEFKTASNKVEFEKAKKLWLNRHDQKSLEQALAIFEKLDKAEPGIYEVLLYLCRGNYLLADGHLDDKEMKKKIWEKGAFWGEKALAVNTAFFDKVVKQKTAMEDSLDVLTKGEASALYWTAVNLGKWAKLSGTATTLKYKGKIKKMIDKVTELDTEYFYGAVYRYWGVYYAVAPFFAGGSLEKSEESFKKSMSIANDYLATHVLYAENFAVKKSDKDLFKKELEWVIAANPNTIPDVMPENTLEQKKARKLLTQMEELF